MQSSPRPILKNALCTSHGPIQRTVHFPDMSTLTRVYAAHSPSAYDRSPIVVSANACALPERGCPGRTYILGDQHPRRPSGGNHVHPRASLHKPPMPPSEPVHDDGARPTSRASFLLPPLSPSDCLSESDKGAFPPHIPSTSLMPAPSISSRPSIGMSFPDPQGHFHGNSPWSSSDGMHRMQQFHLVDHESTTMCDTEDDVSRNGYHTFSLFTTHSLMDDGCLGGF